MALTNVERYLRDTNDRLWRSYVYVRAACEEDASARRLIGPPYFTDHGVEHSRRMLAMLDHLVYHQFSPWHVSTAVTSAEAYVILCAVFAHDLGMRNTALACGGSPDEKRGNARLWHARRSEEFIRGTDLIDWHDGMFPEEFRRIVGRVSASHCAPLVLMITEPPERASVLGDELDTAFCAAVIKALDCLDITNRRIGLSALRSEAYPASNKLRMWPHYYVDAVFLRHEFEESTSEALSTDRVSVFVRYSLPRSWKEAHVRGDPNPSRLEVENPYHIIKAIAERMVRYAHGDVPHLLRSKGIHLFSQKEDVVICYSDYDSDGQPKIDFGTEFLDKVHNLEQGERARVQHTIEDMLSDYEGRLLPERAGLFQPRKHRMPPGQSLREGEPRCAETLAIASHFKTHPDAILVRSGFPEGSSFLIALDALASQGVLRKEGAGDYRLCRDSQLWKEACKLL
jgi:hypothetical protein